MTLSDWQASIFQAVGNYGEPRIWFLTLTAPTTYPTSPPRIKFTSRIVMDCVDQPTGAVLNTKVPYLAAWTPNSTLFGALLELKTLIGRASRSQPPDGTSFAGAR